MRRWWGCRGVVRGGGRRNLIVRVADFGGGVGRRCGYCWGFGRVRGRGRGQGGRRRCGGGICSGLRRRIGSLAVVEVSGGYGGGE